MADLKCTCDLSYKVTKLHIVTMQHILSSMCHSSANCEYKLAQISSSVSLLNMHQPNVTQVGFQSQLFQ